MSSATPPEISLIICTRDRAAQLERCLEAIAQLTFDGEWQLIVVDDGSADDTGSILTDFAQNSPIRTVRVSGVGEGLGRAHEMGLAAASGELIVLTDDDCYPAPDYLERMHECFAEQPNLGFVGGRILLHDPSDLPITIRPSTRRRELPPRSMVPAGFVQGANLAFRRMALEQAGGFDSRLGAGTPFNCEDIDTARRVSAAGWWGAYDPRPVVRHHHGRKTAAEGASLRRSYDLGRGAYYARALEDPVARWKSLRHWGLTMIRRPSAGRVISEVTGAFRYWRRYRGMQAPTAFASRSKPTADWSP